MIRHPFIDRGVARVAFLSGEVEDLREDPKRTGRGAPIIARAAGGIQHYGTSCISLYGEPLTAFVRITATRSAGGDHGVFERADYTRPEVQRAFVGIFSRALGVAFLTASTRAEIKARNRRSHATKALLAHVEAFAASDLEKATIILAVCAQLDQERLQNGASARKAARHAAFPDSREGEPRIYLTDEAAYRRIMLAPGRFNVAERLLRVLNSPRDDQPAINDAAPDAT